MMEHESSPKYSDAELVQALIDERRAEHVGETRAYLGSALIIGIFVIAAAVIAPLVWSLLQDDSAAASVGKKSDRLAVTQNVPLASTQASNEKDATTAPPTNAKDQAARTGTAGSERSPSVAETQTNKSGQQNMVIGASGKQATNTANECPCSYIVEPCREGYRRVAAPLGRIAWCEKL